MNKDQFSGMPNWWLYKVAKQYAEANQVKLLTIEDFEAALRNYILYAINNN